MVAVRSGDGSFASYERLVLDVLESLEVPAVLADGSRPLACNARALEFLGFDSIDEIDGRVLPCLEPFESTEIRPIPTAGSECSEECPALIIGARGCRAQLRRTQVPALGPDATLIVFVRVDDPNDGVTLVRPKEAGLDARDARRLAHDVGNVLTVIVSAASALERLGASIPDVSSTARQIVDAGERAHRWSRSVLRAMKFGNRPRGRVDASTTIRELTEFLGRVVGDRAELRFELSERPTTVAMHRDELERVLFELVNNAAAASQGDGEIIVRCGYVDPDPSSGHGQVLIEVLDDGIGVRPRESWVTPRERPARRPPGFGVGLPSLRESIASHGGYFRIEPRHPRGTRAVIALPEVPGTGVSHRPATGVATHPICVLLVEDESLVRIETARALRAEGLDVVDVGSGVEAFDALASSTQIDVIVADLTLPDVDGRKIVRIGERCRIPTIVVSGDPETETGIDSCHESIRKPFDIDNLVDAIRRVARPNDRA